VVWLGGSPNARQTEQLVGHDPISPAVTALGTRIIARFSELEAQRAGITTKFKGLQRRDSGARGFRVYGWSIHHHRPPWMDHPYIQSRHGAADRARGRPGLWFVSSAGLAA